MPRQKTAAMQQKTLSPEKQAIACMGSAVEGMIENLTRYADAYNVVFENGIGSDYVIGDAWRDTCEGVIGLLCGDIGSIDGASADRRLRELIERFFKVVGDDSLSLPIEKVPGTQFEIVYAKEKVIPDEPVGLTRLTDRQRELVAQLSVKDDLATFTGEQIPDWPLLKKVMIALGSKWNSKRVGFVFPDDSDAADIVRRAQQEGTILDPKAAEFFETPDALADTLIARCEITGLHTVLEPSAGKGALVKAVLRTCSPRIHCYEPFPENYSALLKYLSNSGITYQIEYTKFNAVTSADCLPADRVVMNPPFSNKQDIDHVYMAFSCLKPGGILTAIMSGGTRFRSDKKTTAFRNWLDLHNGQMWDNEPKAFHASGTDVSTVMIKVRKPML